MLAWRKCSCALLLLATVQQCAFTASNNFDPNLMCSLIKNGTTIKDPRACNTWIQCVDGEPISGTCENQLFYDLQSNECVEPQTVKCISSNPCAASTGTDGFVADPYSCNGYYYCSNGTASHGICEPEFNFDSSRKDCIRDLPCNITMYPENYCNIVPAGVFIKDTANSKSYQLCRQGILDNNTCPGTFVFDAFVGMCNYPESLDCEPPVLIYPKQPNINKCTKAGNSCGAYTITITVNQP